MTSAALPFDPPITSLRAWLDRLAARDRLAIVPFPAVNWREALA